MSYTMKEKRKETTRPLPGETTESSQSSRPKWHRIRDITGRSPIPGSIEGDQLHVKLALIRKYGGEPKIKSQAQFLRLAGQLVFSCLMVFQGDKVIWLSACSRYARSYLKEVTTI
ncbi:hypothetical protein TNCV_3714971 [Trichonephila clavipes]|nr:hypothetical protein TNCV_3714971 [Trichonephila clavipes]